MNETQENTEPTSAVLRRALPATTEELSSKLGIAPAQVWGVIRTLRLSGYPVKLKGGVYVGADQLSHRELLTLEHRSVAYLATLAQLLGAMFPTPERAELARVLADDLARMDAVTARDRRIRTLMEQKARIDQKQADIARELAELTAVA